MMPPPRVLQLAALAAFIVTAYIFLIPSSSPKPRWRPIVATSPQEELATEKGLFKELHFPPKFEYRRHCITARQSRDKQRESVIELPQILLSEPHHVEIGDEKPPEAIPESDLPACEKEIVLDVPEWDSDTDVNTTSLIIGVATTMERMNGSLEAMSRWLSDTGTPLVALLVDQPKLDPVRESLDAIQLKAESLKIDLIFEPYEGSFAEDSEGRKNFGLAPVLQKNVRPETRWFAVIDDDTFFLSLHRTFRELNRFNSSSMMYIGALTEGFTRVQKEGLKAWGGAGIFISAPLMQLLSTHHKECLKLDKFFGDLLWRDCAIEYTSPGIRLTEMPGLNQIDLWGDLTGWYEGRHVPLHTVHHWKSWHNFPIPNSHLVVDAAGPEAFLQRYKLFNNTVLTNGFSIVEYPKGFPDLERVELTFADDVGKTEPPGPLEFHHSIGKTRPPLTNGVDKISWHFRRALKNADGTIRQFYIKGRAEDNDVSVIEIDWKRDD